jgi:hypothetical protein
LFADGTAMDETIAGKRPAAGVYADMVRIETLSKLTTVSGENDARD